MYNGSIQRVRGELLSATFKPQITFTIDSLTFNTSCVKVFQYTQYIVISIDEKKRYLIIEPCKADERGSMKFANQKGGKNSPRKCPAGPLCRAIYRFMGWNKAVKYIVKGAFLGFGCEDNTFYFKLDGALQAPLPKLF